MDIMICDMRALAPHRETALAALSEERRAKVLACAREETALLSLGAGLLLRRFVGAGPFLIGACGKPELPGGPCFSLSHSGALAVLAVHGARVGVDTEPLSRRWSESAARRVLAPAEYAALPVGDAAAFFTLWTRKEAVLKACGRGFTLDPRGFSVLPEAFCHAAGTRWALATLRWNDQLISAAAEGAETALRLTPVPVTPEELLDKRRLP